MSCAAVSQSLTRRIPYMQALEPRTAQFVESLKGLVDPGRSMNPGVLQLR